MALHVPPLRLVILRSLTAALERAVYQYDEAVAPQPMTGKVFRGRVIFGESDPLPMLSILEAPIPPEQVPSPRPSGSSTGAWDLLLQGFVDDDYDNPTDPAHYLMAVAKAELAVEREKNEDFNILGLGQHVTDISWGAGTVRPPDEISAKAYFWLPMSLTVVEDLTKPFEVNTD